MNHRHAAAGLIAALALISACSGNLPGSIAPPARAIAADSVNAQVSDGRIVLRNELIERVWTLSPYLTAQLTDLRTGQVWAENSPDFALEIGGQRIDFSRFTVSGEPVTETLPKGGLRVTLTLAPTPLASLPVGLTLTRTVEMYPGIAGLRTQTTLNSPLPLTLSGYSMEETMLTGSGLHAQAQALHAGGDWREPEWDGPVIKIGDAQPGDWRTSSEGEEVSGTAQWLSVADAQDRRLFLVMERNDQASSTMSFRGGRAQARVDFSRDVIYAGPLEEQIHIGNPGPGPGRVRAVLPGTPLKLEPVFLGLALNADDEPWQHYKYLDGHRMAPYRREVTFNSNGVDGNVISTGAKDDLDFATFLVELDIAKQIGIETFVFDDGWQGRSGDWCPDSEVDDPACQDPRRGTDAGYPARFPDAGFVAVQEQLRAAGMNLGLWMSPMHFHPSAIAFQKNPQWACLPLSAGLLALNQAQPYDGSSEAGIVQWNPEALSPTGGKAIDHIESRIRTAIEQWGARYFKFDFTAWLDCAGAYTVDMYGYRESFMRMLDRILADHPDVTIQMDETNDYRLWPYEAIARGPTWYQNGSPTPNEALHANWVLAPYVPVFALGRNAVRFGDLENYSADYQMAVGLLSHVTFFNDLRDLPADAIPTVRKWTDYYKAHRADIAQLVYPLLAEDPYSGDNWAAFQAWNPESARGTLFVYRQDSADGLRRITLRNVPDGEYRLIEAPDEKTVIEASGAQLRAGLDIAISSQRSARILRIEPKSTP